MQQAFEGAEYVAITSDGWTSITTKSYMTITRHYVDEGHLRSCVLQTCALEERHTAENLAAHLRSATSTWGLDKVVTCVHDNATNMVLGNETLLDCLGQQRHKEVILCFKKIYPFNYRHLNSAGDPRKVEVDFKKTVAASLERRMGPKNLQRAGCVSLLASALDPRHKHSSFVPMEMRQAVREKLADQYHSLQLPAHVQEEDEEATASADKDCDGPDEEDNTASTSWAEYIQHQPKQKKSSLLDFFGGGHGEHAEDHD